jgi:hypothetical protein
MAHRNFDVRANSARLLDLYKRCAQSEHDRRESNDGR